MAFVIPVTYAAYLGATFAVASLSAAAYALTRPAAAPAAAAAAPEAVPQASAVEPCAAPGDVLAASCAAAVPASAIEALPARETPPVLERIAALETLPALETLEITCAEAPPEAPLALPVPAAEPVFASPKEVQSALNAEVRAVVDIMVQNIDRAIARDMARGKDPVLIQNGERVSVSALKKAGAPMRSFRRGSETQPVLTHDQIIKEELSKKFDAALAGAGFRAAEDLHHRRVAATPASAALDM